MHPTSLPGPFGIGDLGPPAFAFLDYLVQTGQRLWQVLPLGPTGYGDSPYQSFSSFAGNPLLISPERLLEAGLVEPAHLERIRVADDRRVDFGQVIPAKMGLFRTAFERFRAAGSSRLHDAWEAFVHAQAGWLDDYALFMALKDAHGGRAWTQWEPDLRARRPATMAQWRRQLAREVQFQAFLQFLFFDQWSALHAACHARGVSIVGDLPIFVAGDSADVWAHPELFQLDASGRPTVVAGVPPDYFSATGQLWGNPLYRWDVLEPTGFAWWIERLRATLAMVDVVRLDHFRGFDAYWEVPGGAATAAGGRWVKGPGARFFEAVRQTLGDLPLIAEDLGKITPDVEALRDRFDLPGMRVLQFAFGADPKAPDYRPHHFPRHCVVYTGTHDNDTTVGWWHDTDPATTTRTAHEVVAERTFAERYLHSDGTAIHWDMIRMAWQSVADTAIAPMQDVLGLGTEARMNFPGRIGGNWTWRAPADAWAPGPRRDQLAQLTATYDRWWGAIPEPLRSPSARLTGPLPCGTVADHPRSVDQGSPR